MNSDEATNRSKHQPVLDGIRGLAILLVMVCHLTGFGGTNPIDRWGQYLAWWGSIGVDLFFVLSGFLITGILLETRMRPRFFRNFYVRRALRIFPLYYAILFACIWVIPGLLPPAKAARFGSINADLPYYFFYLQNFSIARMGAPQHGILDITWSLAIEEQFYLVWPAVVYFLTARTVKRVCLALIGFAFLSRVAVIEAFDITGFAVYALTPCRMDALAVGAFLAVKSREMGGLEGWAGHGRRVFLGCGGVALLIVILELVFRATYAWAPGLGPFSLRIGFTFVAIAFGGLLVWVADSRRESRINKLFSSRSLTFLGRYSYGLYLIHLPIRAVVRDRFYGPSYSKPPHTFHRLWGSELPGQLLFYALCAGPILVAAWGMYHLFEKHFLRLKRFFP